MTTEKSEGTPAHLFEPYEKRRKRHASVRKASIAREAARLAETYSRLRLPVPAELLPPPSPPVPEVAFTPFRIKRSYKATGRPTGRPPSAAREAAISKGLKTYMGRPCRHGHGGLRYVTQNACVGCAADRRKATKRLAVTGAWHSTEQPDAVKAGYRVCIVCGRAFDPWTRLRSVTCGPVCARRSRGSRGSVRTVGKINHKAGRRAAAIRPLATPARTSPKGGKTHRRAS